MAESRKKPRTDTLSQRLDRNPSLFKVIFEHASDGMFVVDLEGSTVVEANHSAAQALSYSTSEMRGLHLSQLASGEELEGDSWSLRSLRKQGQARNASLTLVRKDGTAFAADVAFKLLELKGRTSCLVSFRDVSDRSALEKQMQRENRELQTLHDIAKMLNSSRDLREILDRSLDATLEAIGFESGGIFLIDESAEHLVLQASRGFEAGILMAYSRVPRPEGLAWRAAESGEPVFLTSPAEKGAYRPEVARQAGVRYFMAIPLRVSEGAVGAIVAFTKRESSLDGRNLDMVWRMGLDVGQAISRAVSDERTRQTEGLLVHAFKAFDLPVFIWDQVSRRIRGANLAALTLVGYSEDDVVGTPVATLGLNIQELEPAGMAADGKAQACRAVVISKTGVHRRVAGDMRTFNHDGQQFAVLILSAGAGTPADPQA